MTSLFLHTENATDKLPTPKEIRDEFALSNENKSFIEQSRSTIRKILLGHDDRKLLIVGPCSIHDIGAAREYALEFQEVAKEVASHFFMVMRTYFEKPRTVLGWKGLLYDPDLDGSYDLAKGVRLTRQLLSELCDLQVPAASEFLEITTAHYFADLLSWGCIGARTCSSPPHRQLAASLNLPIGFKNTTDGSIENAVNGILSASTSHVFLGLDMAGEMVRIWAPGNPSCHIVLRGGESGPNYDAHSVMQAASACRVAGICNRVVIDCSHDNCDKRHLKQVNVFQSIVNRIAEGDQTIAGLMLESNLRGGSQVISPNLRYGVSITDPCLDWPTTRAIILESAAKSKLLA